MEAAHFATEWQTLHGWKTRNSPYPKRDATSFTEPKSVTTYHSVNRGKESQKVIFFWHVITVVRKATSAPTVWKGRNILHSNLLLLKQKTVWL